MESLMCNPALIVGLLIGGELACGLIVTMLWLASFVNGNLYSTAATPGFIYAALVATAGAIAVVSSLNIALGPCTRGGCGGQATALRSVMIAIGIVLAALAGAIAFILVPSAIPGLAGTYIKVILGVPLVVIAGMWLLSTLMFSAFASCAGVSSTATNIQIALAYIAAFAFITLLLPVTLGTPIING
jgi:hypothetical protein